MALTEFTKDMAIIQKLDDEPNDVGGLTAAQLKAKFDEAGEALKYYINHTLLAELGAQGAADMLGALLCGEPMSVQAALDVLQMAHVKSGNVPVGGSAGNILRKKSGELYDLEWVNPNWFVTVEFTAEEWGEGEDGTYTLTIPQSAHKRAGADFGCFLHHKVDGVRTSNTWAVLGTQTAWDEDTGAILLSGGDAYDGTAVFYGTGVAESAASSQDDESVAVLTDEYDQDSEVSADIDGESYSVTNVSTDADGAADGTIIITKVEE